MKKYQVMMTVTADEFVSVFKTLRGNGIAFEVDEVGERNTSDAVPAPRATRKRTSKVNEAILDRLHKGGADAADLRVSLEHAGLSPNSLSTGLALLQKDGKIRRGDDGSYELAA
jgi:hypothetical protein